MSESDLAIVAALVFAWGTLSARLERFDVTAPIIFVLAGVLLTHGPLATIGFVPAPELVKALAEVTLVLVLFSDASRVGLREFRADAGLYGRLLGVGLPLTIGLGTLLALALFGGMSIWLALLVGAALAPTDAALGAGMMVNPAVPARIRRLLNVESGLNDGIATPFVLVAIAGAQTAEHAHGTGPGKAVAELAVGLLIGAAVGSAGGWLIRLANRRGWAAEGFAGSAVLGLAICAYASALALHGNGFIAAFTGGLAYGAVGGRGGARLVPFVEETGALVSLLVWLSFGAVAVVAALEGLTWQVAVYAVLSLTVIRMVPTAIALAGVRLGRPAVVLVGWFGPRGLASVVFALLALEEIGQPAASQVVTVITVTVLLSVVAHGATADPLARRFGPRLARAADGAEHPGLPDVPERRLIRRAPAAASGTGADPARQAGDQPASGSDRYLHGRGRAARLCSTVTRWSRGRGVAVMPADHVHFNGSVNLGDAESVMREIASRIPSGLRRIPDGETGDRGNWIFFQLQKFLQLPWLVPDGPVGEADGEYEQLPELRLAEGVDPGSVTWPDIGYAEAYLESYRVFARLRADGVIPAGVRFQVEYPTPLASIGGYIVPEQQQVLLGSYERAMFADLDRLLAAIPPGEVAVQWDVAVEFGVLEEAWAPGGAQAFDAIIAALARCVDRVPPGIPVGLHLCYGDYGHEHFTQPASLALQVRVVNAVAAAARRPVSFVSFTVPQYQREESYFAPLAGLDADPGTELNFALVPYHPAEQAAGTTGDQVRLIDTALAASPGGRRDWGICTECGMGRVDRDDVPALLDLHREIITAP